MQLEHNTYRRRTVVMTSFSMLTRIWDRCQSNAKHLAKRVQINAFCIIVIVSGSDERADGNALGGKLNNSTRKPINWWGQCETRRHSSHSATTSGVRLQKRKWSPWIAVFKTVNVFRIGWTMIEKALPEHDPKLTHLYDLLPTGTSLWRHFRSKCKDCPGDTLE